MSEPYTRDDVIVWPDDPRLEGAIGKACYVDNSPVGVLTDAQNDNDTSFVLQKVEYNSPRPFVSNRDSHSCIILKKELKKKWIPFDLSDEKVRDSLRGKWIRNKDKDIAGVIDEVQITRFRLYPPPTGRGWEVDCHLKFYSEDELLEKYTFLDGSPCGVEVEE